MKNHLKRTLQAQNTPISLCLLLLLLVLLGQYLGDAAARTVTEILIHVVAVAGLFVFVGNSGIISFGHVTFMCVGAYSVAWMMVEPSMKEYTLVDLPSFLLTNSYGHLPSMLLAGGLAAFIALLSGAVLMRLSGIAASIATFALLAMVNVIYANWDNVTGGTSSVVGIPTQVDSWTALLWAGGVLFVLNTYTRSRYGLQLRAMREDAVAARASGINLYLISLGGFVLSAFVMGLAGGLEAQFLGVVNPDAYYLNKTFLLLSMLVIGGVSCLSSAVVGTIAVSFVSEALILLEKGVSLGNFVFALPSGAQQIVVGILMMGVLIVRPNGILGRHEIAFLPRKH